MKRRAFLTNTVIGVAAFAGTSLTSLGVKGQQANESEDREVSSGSGAGDNIGRPVRVVSIGFKGAELSLEQIAKHVDDEGSQGADVILLPETLTCSHFPHGNLT